MAEKKGMTARVWLAMLNVGGRYSAGEIAQLVDEPDTTAVHQLLASMVRGSSVRRFDKVVGHPVQFGVTAACRVPQGITIGDVLACDLQRHGDAA